ATELGWFKKRTEAQNNEHPDWDKTARHSEKYLASLLLPMFKKGMIILADRGFFSFELWCNAAATDAELCWRIKDDVGVNILKMLPDKSYLVTLKREKKQIEARLIEYTIAGSDEVFRLLTTITDHREADAKSLAWLYHERWEIESTYKELKKHLNLSRITMRSKTPELVQQEFLALVLVHFAVRGL
ncbi:IS4 family transposase, partial [Sphingobium sp. 22B]|uniref:IS4 family transposase n=1 Tax=Sphingobium sp. 22B TaxID=936474 RepID=UPI00128FF154